MCVYVCVQGRRRPWIIARCSPPAHCMPSALHAVVVDAQHNNIICPSIFSKQLTQSIGYKDYSSWESATGSHFMLRMLGIDTAMVLLVVAYVALAVTSAVQVGAVARFLLSLPVTGKSRE